MHFKNESGTIPVSNYEQTTGTTTGTCTSTTSTDSGVSITDNETSQSPSKTNSRCTATTADNMKDVSNEGDVQSYNGTFNDADTAKFNAASQHSHLNGQNFTNITLTPQCNDGGATIESLQPPIRDNDRGKPSLTPHYQMNASFHVQPNSQSPTVSIRSATISIVSIDENEIDSSVVDSDSDYEMDAEGAHGKCTVQRLGEQIIYDPNSPDLPNINKGLTVVSQKISGHNDLSSGGNGPLPEDLLNGSLSPPSGPQIGSIALNNSNDVTFGDKNFFKGPVTIQQILIDNRDKWKPVDENSFDNPAFNPDHKAKESENAENNLNSASDRPYGSHRKAIIITGTIIILTILVGVVIGTSNIFRTSTRKNGDDESGNGTLRLVYRSEWGGLPPKQVLDKLNLPVHRAIISHTASDGCDNAAMCEYRVRLAQKFHMESNNWDDIGYNFLIGGNGRVYVGRGWDSQGAHTKGFNVDSVGIAFIGTFTTTKPTDKQLKALELLLEEGVRLNKLVKDYHLYGARQLSATESPGDTLFSIIRTWPHFSEVL